MFLLARFLWLVLWAVFSFGYIGLCGICMKSTLCTFSRYAYRLFLFRWTLNAVLETKLLLFVCILFLRQHCKFACSFFSLLSNPLSFFRILCAKSFKKKKVYGSVMDNIFNFFSILTFELWNWKVYFKKNGFEFFLNMTIIKIVQILSMWYSFELNNFLWRMKNSQQH